MSITRQSSSPKGLSGSERDTMLATDDRGLHRSLIEDVVATGRVPTLRELADRHETTEEAIRAGLTALVAADYVAFDASGQVSCLYPFSATPTAHTVIIGGQRSCRHRHVRHAAVGHRTHEDAGVSARGAVRTAENGQ